MAYVFLPFCVLPYKQKFLYGSQCKQLCYLCKYAKQYENLIANDHPALFMQAFIVLNGCGDTGVKLRN